MRVFVYFNLHRKCWSVKALDGACKGKVIAHARKVTLRDAEFRVSEAGRQRVLREGRKNVHAGVVGELEGLLGDLTTAAGWRVYTSWEDSDRRYEAYGEACGKPVTYNPRVYANFVELSQDGLPVGPMMAAPMVVLSGRKVRAFDPCDMPEDRAETLDEADSESAERAVCAAEDREDR